MNTVRLVRDSAFGLFLLLVFLSPSLQNGPWVWWRVVTFPWFGNETRSLGVLALVPVLLVAIWAFTLLRGGFARGWRWGDVHLTVPLGLYTLMALLSLRLAPRTVWWTELVLIAALWLVYLYVVNERPRLGWVWVTILGIQGAVAVAQFALQHEVGLTALGEPVLKPGWQGASVFIVNETVYLRGYGLTYHPNALAALMAVALLSVMVLKPRAYLLAFFFGFAGLIVSFSRGGWLAFALGSVVWLARRANAVGWQGLFKNALRAAPVILLLVVLSLPYADFLTTRWINIDNVYELRSVNERQRDAAIAMGLMALHPAGVGISNYPQAARTVDPDAAVVHNAFLLTGAEIGWLGLAAMLWFTGRALWKWRSPYHPAWVAWCISNLFDIVLWVTTGLRGAVMVALLLAMMHDEEKPTVIS